MKTLTEIEDDPIEFVSWAKAQIAAEHGNDPARLMQWFRSSEAAARARGVTFANFSEPLPSTVAKFPAPNLPSP
jgi:hypothetical protein